MIHIVQALCPARHCLAALPYDPAVLGPGEARHRLAMALVHAVLRFEINPHCGICGSEELHYEDGVTRFETLEEALPAILACQADQLRTRDLIDALKRDDDDE